MAEPNGTSLRSDYCVFMRDGQRFALSTNVAKEVLEARPFTPVPHAPPELLGAFNLRGEVVPLVNLDRFIDVNERPAARGDTLLLLSHRDVALAAVVDQVVVIKHVSPWEIRRVKLDQGVRSPLVRGLFGKEEDQVTVLDGERLLAVIVDHIAAGLRGSARTSGMPAVYAAASGGAGGVATPPVGALQDGPESITSGASDGVASDARDPGGAVPAAQLPAGGR